MRPPAEPGPTASRRSRRTLPVAIAALTAAAVAASPAPRAGAAGAHGRIAFEATRTTRAGGLFVMDANGSHRTRVSAGAETNVVVARGAYAYSRPVGTHEDVVVTDARGPRDLGPGRPTAFSPDGSTLVVARADAAWELRDRVTGAVRGTFPPTFLYLGWSAGGILWARNADLVVTQADGSGAVTVASGVVGGPGRPSWSPDGRWIAYSTQADPPGAPVLHVVRADGSGDLALGTTSSSFSWSPDGTRIAFASADHLLTLAAPGGETHDTGARVSELAAGLGSWSPDGTRFAFRAAATGTGGPLVGPLTVLSTATDTTRVVSSSGDSPAWSPDGRTLLVRTAANGTAAVSAVAGATAPRLLARDTGSFAWLSDGRAIVYLNRETGEQLAVVTPGGGAVRFIPGTQNELEPAWAPDGTRLAFASRSAKTDVWTIAVANADGAHMHVVARSTALEPSPSWSPDGRFLAYAGDGAIDLVPAAGGRPRRVTGAELPWTLAWSPDGKRIAFGNTPGDSDYADIVLVDPDGTHRRTVVHEAAGLNWGGVAWSPDGRTLAVARRSDQGGDPSGTPDLYLVAVGSGRARELALDTSDPSFSPDGKQIAAAAGDGTIVVLDLTRHGATRTVASGSHPAWSRR